MGTCPSNVHHLPRGQHEGDSWGYIARHLCSFCAHVVPHKGSSLVLREIRVLHHDIFSIAHERMERQRNRVFGRVPPAGTIRWTEQLSSHSAAPPHHRDRGEWCAPAVAGWRLGRYGIHEASHLSKQMYTALCLRLRLGTNTCES